MIEIKNIIFDFGGVIINISHHQVEKAFKELGVRNFDQLFSQATQSKLFQQFEKGEIAAFEFRKRIRALINLDISNEKLDEAWNQIICDYPPDRIDLLNRINQYYRLFLLSNTNVIHYDFYIPKFEKQFGYPLESLFEKAFWSFKFGKRKPDLDAYNRLMVENQLIPAETLFIDDSIQNILVAHELGLNTVHLTDEMDVVEIFNDGKFDPTFLFKQSKSED